VFSIVIKTLPVGTTDPSGTAWMRTGNRPWCTSMMCCHPARLKKAVARKMPRENTFGGSDLFGRHDPSGQILFENILQAEENGLGEFAPRDSKYE